jgi:hypothetical protein
MNYLLALIFGFNLITSAIMVKETFPHMTGMVEKGKLSQWMKTWALVALTTKGIVAALSFLTLMDNSDAHDWLLGAYAVAMANVHLWVIIFHRNKWGQNHG